MSASLAMQVFVSDLPGHLKPTAAVFALFAGEDGRAAFPSVRHVAWCVSLSHRRTQVHVAELVALGVLVPTTSRRGGRSSTRYDVRADALPTRGTWADYKRAIAPVEKSVEKLLISSPEGCCQHHPWGAASIIPGVLPASSDPLLDPGSDPRTEKAAPAAPHAQAVEKDADEKTQYRVVLAIAHDVLNGGGSTLPYPPDQFGAFVEAVGRRLEADRAADLFWDAAAPPVARDVIHRACAAALVARLKTRCVAATLRPRHARASHGGRR